MFVLPLWKQNKKICFIATSFSMQGGKIVHREDEHLPTCPKCFLVRERLWPEKNQSFPLKKKEIKEKNRGCFVPEELWQITKLGTELTVAISLFKNVFLGSLLSSLVLGCLQMSLKGNLLMVFWGYWDFGENVGIDFYFISFQSLEISWLLTFPTMENRKFTELVPNTFSRLQLKDWKLQREGGLYSEK